MNEARDEMRRKAESIEKSKAESRRNEARDQRGYGGGGGGSGYGGGGQSYGGGSGHDQGGYSGSSEREAPVAAVSKPASSWDNKPCVSPLLSFVRSCLMCSCVIHVQKKRCARQGHVAFQGQEVRCIF